MQRTIAALLFVPLIVVTARASPAAHPDSSPDQNTMAIQAAINAAYAAGGGDVVLTEPGVYRLAGTQESFRVQTLNRRGELRASPITNKAHLVLRSGIYLKCAPGVVLEGENPAYSVVAPVDMTKRGGIVGCHIRSVYMTSGDPGLGSGIFNFISEGGSIYDTDYLIDFHGLEISHVANYGIGSEFGRMSVDYEDVYIHDVGGDGIDHKARPNTAGQDPVGNTMHNVRVERYGLRAAGKSCVDIRGRMTVSEITCNGSIGIRFSAGLSSGLDRRSPSDFSTLTGFHVDCGGAEPGSAGVILLESGGMKVSDGTVADCGIGVRTSYSSSGFGLGKDNAFSNVSVDRSTIPFEFRTPVSRCERCSPDPFQ